MKTIMNINTKRGFTLLEMLVVLGIIAIIVAFGAVSFSTAQSKARDAKRKGDLKSIQNSMEQYFSACGSYYPTPQNNTVGNAIFCPAPSTGIMPTVPLDPRTTTPYPCSGCSGSAYQVCATLETETSTFCIRNQQ